MKAFFAALLSLGLLVGSAGAASAATHHVSKKVHVKPAGDQWSHFAPKGDQWSGDQWSGDQWSGDQWSGRKL